MRLNILAFAAGIIALQMQPELPAAWPWALAGLALAVPAVRWRNVPPVRVLGVLACLALGFAWAAWRADIRLADALPAAWEGRDIEVVGVVAALPQDFSQGSRFEFAVERRLTAPDRKYPWGATAVVPERIILSWYQGQRDGEEFVHQPVHPGERWQMTVRLKRPHGNANPNGFDYEAWLLERNIRATGYVRQNPPQRLDEMVWQPEYVVERLRHGVRASFAAMLPGDRYPWAGILVALVIGDQRAIQGELWTTFNRTGTTHLMSISGLHVTMVAALFGLLAGWVWRRVPALALRLPAQRAALLAGCLAAFLYVLLAGFAVPAQRTLYMLLVAALAMGSGRVIAPSRTLCLALLVVLLIDPWAVLAAGFWLSFGAVGVLLYVGAAVVGEAVGWRERIRAWGVVQWAATLASLPILLLVFQQFSLVSPLANAVAIPVVSFIVTPLALLAAVIPWWQIAALAHAVLGWLMVFLEWCAAWPVWQAPAPPLWAAVVAGLGVAICLLPRGMPGRLLGAVLLLPAIFWPVARPAEGEAWVTVLDVGQGLAAIVRTREHTLIYDPGPLYSAESDAGQRVVVPYLRSLGIDTVDILMVTHLDSDHAGGTASVKSALAVGEVVSSLGDAGTEPCRNGQNWSWNGVQLTVLHPETQDYAEKRKSNNLSCVLRIDAGGRRMLLTSDIEARDEAALLQRDPAALKADVLLVPHHGSRTSSTPEFIAAVGASDVMIPVGYRNRFGHPKADVVARYEATGTRLWRTDRDGALRVALDGQGVTVNAWRNERRRYWHGR
ncbi:MAG: DNA internalization-related competence protein ComEC/Rec2 [Dechloromonas sp.]|uniref:DNA internalization-related competence protein ComEC/Rec2 n=1 Tax=Candidatus Dechloromonas phosphorivorans TaxID=2899244 RepID=A0A9D7LWG8_9RHOO|nr:DNA internalization-related competence protein ComEC/Rec2 [Candidatus Dechloromonas phosphorivorans]